MALFVHLFIAFSFIILFYIGVNYSALKYEIIDIETLYQKLSLVEDKQKPYYIEQYNKAVERYNTLKQSVFAVPLLRLCKKLDREFSKI